MNLLAFLGVLLVGLLVTGLMVAFIAWAWGRLERTDDELADYLPEWVSHD